MHGPLYMDAEIRPNRSLTERGFIVLISVVTAANVASAAVFVSMGATFVPVFLGFDVLAVIVAFWASFRSARRIERVQVSSREVRVVQQTPRDTRLVWESPTAFTRVRVETDDGRAVGVKLLLSGREMDVAAALSPRERAQFAEALERAIWRARRERG
ncbi:DUF2244 domain-containing protein [Phenylobacterium soli]|uniref:DUF2244 domain-containing protein n=1 Tax=Phenylobacterium soli TaxID=2170551 RepID=A0A328AFR7_9CAUL|nr:DUF2244 domain-containing protein [Phenylobacterium soli]RAK53592.1 hypothetical protein DJ017_03145 [Phenylobacterium soli]